MKDTLFSDSLKKKHSTNNFTGQMYTYTYSWRQPLNTTSDTYFLATRNTDKYRIWGIGWEWEWRDWTREGSTSYLWV